VHAVQVLSQWLADKAVIAHAARAALLVRVVRALLAGGMLSLTHLGRTLSGPARVKHQIKAVDRLLGNRHLQRERDGIYRALAKTLLFGSNRPVIVVDWSDFELGRQWLMLKAAVPVGGRAISVYERVFPFKRYNSPSAHREFLRALHAILPDGCRPIIVTDAGFRGPWFRAVEAYGWDWVGRVRNKIKYYREETGRWRFTDSLYREATTTPSYVGEVALSKRQGCRFHLYLVRAYQPRIGDLGDLGRSARTRPYTDEFTAHRGCWQLRFRTNLAARSESTSSTVSGCRSRRPSATSSAFVGLRPTLRTLP
jgi:hypothetical protein